MAHKKSEDPTLSFISSNKEKLSKSEAPEAPKGAGKAQPQSAGGPRAEEKAALGEAYPPEALSRPAKSPALGGMAGAEPNGAKKAAQGKEKYEAWSVYLPKGLRSAVKKKAILSGVTMSQVALELFSGYVGEDQGSQFLREARSSECAGCEERPKKGSQFAVPKAQLKAVKLFSLDNGMSMAEMLSKAAEEYMERHGGKGPDSI